MFEQQETRYPFFKPEQLTLAKLLQGRVVLERIAYTLAIVPELMKLAHDPLVKMGVCTWGELVQGRLLMERLMDGSITLDSLYKENPLAEPGHPEYGYQYPVQSGLTSGGIEDVWR